MSLVTILKTNVFEKWFDKLKDRQAKSIILIHIGRMTDNNFGVTKSVGSGIFEKKFTTDQDIDYIIVVREKHGCYFCAVGTSRRKKQMLKKQNKLRKIYYV